MHIQKETDMTGYEKRASDLLQKMSLEEKIAQLHAIWLTTGKNGELGVKTLQGLHPLESRIDPFEQMKHGIGQITRPLGTQPISPEAGVKMLNRVQRFLMEETRLGIPALPHEECLSGVMVQGATLFPAGINNGALWDEALVEEIAHAIGTELASLGSRQGLSPVLDVCRDARWGRTEECYGEDPYLAGCLATAYVRGLQGPERRIAATLKHYVGHSFSEGARNHAPVRIGPRELADTFLLPFEMAVKLAEAASLMPAYHDLDGEPLHESHQYLTEILRDEWGFDGTIVSDYEGLAQLVNDHRTCTDVAHAAAAALNAGVDVELPGGNVFDQGIRKAMEKGILDPAVVNQAVKRVLLQKHRLGLFENPYTREDAIELNTAGHKELARKAAARSIVLLKNDGILPLQPGLKVALIGPLGDDGLSFLNGYSFPVHLIAGGNESGGSSIRTLREELTDCIEGPVVFRKGCDILSERPKEAPVFPGEVGQEGGEQKSYISNDTSHISDAVLAAQEADCVILAVGDLSGLFLTGTVGEGSDVSSLQLPGVQPQLLEALLDSGTPVIVVILSGRPYNLEKGFTMAAAVLQAWLPGQEGAAAIADVLFGRLNPGGKLPVSIPKSAGAMPFFYNYKLKSAGMPIQPDFGSVFPFGFGLSYTQFELRDFQVERDRLEADESVTLSCTLHNTGRVSGDQVVQLYVRDLYAALVRPLMELKGFKRVHLSPGESALIRFHVPCDMLSYTDKNRKRVVEPGEFQFMLGTSSKEIWFRHTITVEGKARILGANWRMQSTVDVKRITTHHVSNP